MTFRDSVHIHEKVTVFIKDPNGKVTEHVIKKPWYEKTLWEKFLTILGLKKEPGTLDDNGKDALARLYGGYTGGSSYSAITYIASWRSYTDYQYKTVTTSYTRPTITYNNSAAPFTVAGSYANLYLTDRTGASITSFHTIAMQSLVTITSGFSWWVEVKLTFSGS